MATAEPGPLPDVVDAETVRRHATEASRAADAVDALKGKIERLREHLRGAEDSLPAHEAEAEAATQAHEAVKARYDEQSGTGA